MINKRRQRRHAFWTATASSCLLVNAASASTTNVPPVVISTLAHEHFFFDGETITRDSVTFPCTGGACNGHGFTSVIGTGDVIVIRFEPPPGMKFAVTRAPGGTETFFFQARWTTTTNDTASHAETPVVTFENLTGTAPVNTFNLTRLSNAGQVITTEQHFTVNGDFTFTAINLQFTVTNAVPALSRTYNPVTSIAAPSFLTARSVTGTSTDATVMAIVPLSQGADRTWNNTSGGLWNTPGSWTPSGVPGPLDRAFLNLPGTYAVTLDVQPTIKSIDLGGNTGTTTLNCNSNTLTLNGPNASVINANGSLRMMPGGLVNNLGTSALINNGTIGGTATFGNVAIQGPFRNEVNGLISLQTRGSTSVTLSLSDPVTSSSFVNNGLIQLQSNSPPAAVTLNVSTGSLVNNGTINAMTSSAGSVRTIGAQLDNFGAMQFDSSCAITKPSAQHVNRAGGTIVVNANTLTVNQSGTQPMFTNQGSITINSPAQMTVAGGMMKNDAGGVIQGTGTLNVSSASFVNQGSVRPGNGGPGTLAVTGAYQQSSQGSLSVDINGATPGTQYDVLQVSGAATLGGKLIATLGNGFLPPVGATFNIVTSSALNGAFDLAFMPGFPDGRHLVLSYGTNDSEGGVAATGTVTATVQLFNNIVIFEPEEEAPLPGTPSAGVLGDFDGDGDLDLAVTISAGSNPGSVVVLFNAGTSGTPPVWQGFSGSIQVPVGVDPSGICTATLDSNSSLDLAVCNRGSNSVTILKNNSSGTFTPQSPTIAVGLQPSSIAAGNFNGAANNALVAGPIDLVVTNGGSDTMQLLINSVGMPGEFAAGPGIPTGNLPVRVDPSDVDNDRDVDLVVVNSGSHNVMVFKNNGLGGFGLPQAYNVGAAPNAVVVRELNGDALPEIVTANQGDGTISILLNNSSAPGTFGGPNGDAISLAVGSSPRSIASLDLQGDGDLDLAVLVDVGGNSAVQLLRNDGGVSPTFSIGELLQVGDGAVQVLAGNMGRGIEADIVTVNSGVPLSLNDGGPPRMAVQPDVSVLLNSMGTVNMPRVVISSLTHEHFFVAQSNQTLTRDMVQFPCTGGACNGPGFTAAIGQGDTIVVRFEAPAGQRFVITRAPGGTQYLTFWGHWQTAMGDSISNFPTGVVTFENLTGTSPSFLDGLNAVSNNGQTILAEWDYTIGNRCSFTAIQVQFPVTHALDHLSRIYGAVNSFSSPSFGSARVVTGAASNATVMRIAPLCPADITGNEVVNVDDLLAVVTHWGSCQPPCPPHMGCPADVVPSIGNCVVNVDDLLAIVQGWGPCP